MQDLPLINPNPVGVTAPTSSTAGVNPTDLLAAVQKQLLSTSGAISSNSSKIEEAISGAIAKTSEANASSKAATESAYNREIGFATDAAANKETSFLEAQKGYATNTAALRDLRTNNEKSIRDLEQRKQEALMAADSATASKISDLILQKYKFEQDATQQVFQNLVSVSNFGLQLAQEQRLGQTQIFNEDQAKSSIALKYGIEVKPGDTLQDVVNRAKPFASAEQKIQLDQATANLALTKENTKLAIAQAAKALRDDKAVKEYDPQGVAIVIQDLIDSNKDLTLNQLKANIASNDKITDKAGAYVKAEELFNAKKTGKDVSSQFKGMFDSPALNLGAKVGQGITDVNRSIWENILGPNSPLLPKK